MQVYEYIESEFPTFNVIHENGTLADALEAFTTRLEKAPCTGQFFYMSAIPLIDDQENAVGIVSFKDILQSMIQSGAIPIPALRIEECMSLYSEIVVGTPDMKVSEARALLRTKGQRNLPVVESLSSAKLIGLIPDAVFIEHQNSDSTLAEIVVKWKRLKNHTPEMLLREMLECYVPPDNRAWKIYFTFPVIDTLTPQDSPRLLGLIGYLDIFRTLLRSPD